jgi:hypothetical protein
MRWARHVACMGKMRNAYEILVFIHENKRPLGVVGVDRRIILKQIFRNTRFEDVYWIQPAQETVLR